MKRLFTLIMVLVAIGATATASPFPGKKVKKVTPESLATMKLLPVKEKATVNALPAANEQIFQMAGLKPDAGKVAGNKAPRKATALITTPPEGTTKYYNRSGSAYIARSYGKTPQQQSGIATIVFCENNEVYILNPISGISAGTYIKGTLEGNQITVQLPQTIYNFSGYNLEVAWLDISAYLDGTASSYYDASVTADRTNTTAVFTIEGDQISLEGSSSSYVLAGVYDDDNMWYGSADYESVYTETSLEEEITPPAGSTPTTYYYTGKAYYSSADHSFSSTVDIVKDGNDVYIKGLATGDANRVILPDAWAKGTLNGTTLTIPQGQYMGMNNGDPVYLVGYSSGLSDITFTYDADADTYTLNNIMVINSKKDALSFWSYTQAGALISAEEPEPEPEPELVVVPSTASVESDWSIESSGSKSVSMATQVAFDGNDVYIQGVPYYFPEAWIKGTISNGVASFPSGQFVGEDNSGKEYICSIDGNDIEFDYDAENQIFTLPPDTYVLETDQSTYDDNATVWVYFTSMKVFKGEIVEPEVVEVPDGLTTEKYTWTGNNLTFDDNDNPVSTPFTNFVNIGFDGNDVYVQGLCADLPEAWVKGTINGNTATFAAGQYFGKDTRLEDYGYTYPHYFVGYGADGIQDVTFTYDAEAKSFVSQDYIVDNEYADQLGYYVIYTDNAWNLLNEVPGKPAEPTITGDLTGTYPKVRLTIPLETTDGNTMNPDKVFYRLFSDIEMDIQPIAFTPDDYENLTETLYEIPYTFDDDWDIYEGGSVVYLNQSNVGDFNRVGVQVVYYGGMDLGNGAPRRAPSDQVADNETEIIWLKVKNYSGIEDLKNAAIVTSVRYYNAAGVASKEPFNGFNIVVKKMSDGTTKIEKAVK